jgi:hypothetical protein
MCYFGLLVSQAYVFVLVSGLIHSFSKGRRVFFSFSPFLATPMQNPANKPKVLPCSSFEPLTPPTTK